MRVHSAVKGHFNIILTCRHGVSYENCGVANTIPFCKMLLDRVRMFSKLVSLKHASVLHKLVNPVYINKLYNSPLLRTHTVKRSLLVNWVPLRTKSVEE